MSERIGPVRVLPEEGDPRAAVVSEGMLDAVADESPGAGRSVLRTGRVLLRENQWRLESLAEQLLVKETLDEHEIYEAARVEHAPQTVAITYTSEAGPAQTT
jgi:cell division protease FtsH